MGRYTLVVRACLAIGILTSTTAFVSPSFADQAAASSAADGKVAANSSDSGSPPSTSSQGNVSFSTGSQASGNNKGDGTARSHAQAAASASATAGAGGISLGLTSETGTSVSSADGNNSATADSAAAGTIGPAHIVLIAQAGANSGPDQMTAWANASDGSYALAEKGILNGLVTFVPGGMTQLLQNATGLQSVSCNASGTCSTATVANDSVSAGIRIFDNTGTINAGNVNAVLNAFLSVEASAGWSYVSAAAISNISGSGSSSGPAFSANVSASIGTSGKSGFWRVTSIDNVKIGGVSAKVWTQGDNICASTKISSRHGLHGKITIVKCRHLKKYSTRQRAVFVQHSHKNWLTKLFSSETAYRK
jgi:hypothetical protein